jgi:RNA polymerase sigma-70 factor (ECF subfamily)
VSEGPEPGVLLEHLFRHQAGRMVAHLARLLGPAHLDVAEDSVQNAMLRALQIWPQQGLPENPPAWLFRVANNIAIDALRRKRLLGDKSEAIAVEMARAASPMHDAIAAAEQIRDDELRMIFMCCHPDLSREVSIALSLKTVGGFSVREIARAFLADETAIAQRLVRAKRTIRERGLSLEMPGAAEVNQRLHAVLDVAYFMFNEGYAAHQGEDLIRQDLCAEALRLARLIAGSPIATPRVHALVALMAFQAARLPARVDQAGDLILLEQQDRTRWDQRLIALGFHHFDQSIAGEDVSEFHIQAAIAATHARAAHAEDIDWTTILVLYDQLLALNHSPVVALNRAVAVSRVRGPEAALRAIEPLSLPGYYLLLAVRGHLLLELGLTARAAECFRAALECPCSAPERRFLQRRLADTVRENVC